METNIEKAVKMIADVNNNYAMGFLSYMQYVTQIADCLNYAGLKSDDVEKANEAIKPFAQKIYHTLSDGDFSYLESV